MSIFKIYLYPLINFDNQTKLFSHIFEIPLKNSTCGLFFSLDLSILNNMNILGRLSIEIVQGPFKIDIKLASCYEVH